MRQKISLTLFVLSLSSYVSAFTLPGDGKWYRVATMGGQHAYFEYVYAQATPHQPSMSVGEITFINSRNTLIQHHQTMGYQNWNQPQFALLNLGGGSEVWVKATNGIAAGEFAIKYHFNGSMTEGDLNDVDLSDNGGILTIYDKLSDDAQVFYQNLKVPAGDVSIGTTETNGAKLAVNGTIRAKEIKVESGPWPDYVFGYGHTSPTLPQLERAIRRDGHLPGVPTAAEVAQDGLSLGSMVRIQMEKIEELTG